jgi:hypothetical protein
MLAFLQHPYMLLAAKAMAFWTSLLSSSERAAGHAEPLTPETTPIPLDCVAALMDLAGDISHPAHPYVLLWHSGESLQVKCSQTYHEQMS